MESTPVSEFVVLLLAVITLGTAAGVGLQRGKISRLRGDVTESEERADRFEKLLLEARTELAQTKTDLAALGRVVTGEAHWVAIGDKLDHHHDEAMIQWKRERDALERIAVAVERPIT